MLKPFKSLLTYLQKGSPNSSSGTLSDDVDEEVAGSTVVPAEAGEEDPLSDPLAFEHDYTNSDAEEEQQQIEKLLGSTSSASASQPNSCAGAGGSGSFQDQFTSSFLKSRTSAIAAVFEEDAENDDNDEEEDIVQPAVVFVDINRLRAPSPLPLELLQPLNDPSPPKTPTTHTVSSPVNNPVPIDPIIFEEEQLKPGVEKPGTSTSSPDDTDASRSDGSDSGLGSDILNGDKDGQQSTTSVLSTLEDDHQEEPPNEVQHKLIDNSHQSSVLLQTNHILTTVPSPTVPVVRVQKLSFDRLPPATPPEPARSALKRASLDDATDCARKRPRRQVQFESVTVFYFARIQGFLCVPSVGGCTLGMEARHMYEKQMTLNEHLAEQRRAHRQQMEQLNPNLTRSQQQQNQHQQSSSDESDEEASSGSDVDAEMSGFLRPVGTKQRRALLKAAGVGKIEASEKDECREIRLSREVCGCRCQGYCDPELCFCSINNIKCQVDRPNFPCNCTGECCGNREGRVEFNPARVRTHYIHTKMRLELEEKQQRLDAAGAEQQQQCSNRTYEPQLPPIRAPLPQPFTSSTSSLLLSPSQSPLSYTSIYSRAPPLQLQDQNHIILVSASRYSPVINSVGDVGMRCNEDVVDYNSLLVHNRDYDQNGATPPDEIYKRPPVVVEPVPESPSSSSNRSNGGSGSQFCNNILQILGIQSTPSPQTKSPVVSTLTTVSSDYSPRRLMGPTTAAGEEVGFSSTSNNNNNNRSSSHLTPATNSLLADTITRSAGESPALGSSPPFLGTNQSEGDVRVTLGMDSSSTSDDWPLRNNRCSNNSNTANNSRNDGEEDQGLMGRNA